MVSYLLFIYFNTMAPGLSWANGGSDGGDLITAAAIRGVAHPTGYPVYLLLASLFQMLPVGSLAFRTNLLSVMAMVGASLCISMIVQRSAQNSNLAGKQMAGVMAGLAFGISGTAWSQAVITEVYALHAFFVALILYLVGDPFLNIHRHRKVFAIGLVLGMALGNHVTTVLLTPGILVLLACGRAKLPDDPGNRRWERWQFVWKDWVRLTAGVAITLSSYLLLPVWAGTRPPVNWGNPVTPRNLLWLVTGKLYQGQFIDRAQWNLGERLQDWANLLLQQFGIPGLILALMGLIVVFAPKRIYLMTLWIAVSVSVFAMSYQVADWYVHLIPVYLVFAIWIGLGFSNIVEALSSYGRMFRYAIGFFCIVYLIALTVVHWKQVDASGDRRAEDFGQEVLDGLPEHAIVFAKGDRTVFTLWYFHYALNGRPDIFILAIDLLPFDWYRQTLRDNYPDLNIPFLTLNIWQETIEASNPAYPSCYPYYSDRTVLNCR
jgi:hypothetical protein